MVHNWICTDAYIILDATYPDQDFHSNIACHCVSYRQIFGGKNMDLDENRKYYPSDIAPWCSVRFWLLQSYIYIFHYHHVSHVFSTSMSWIHEYIFFLDVIAAFIWVNYIFFMFKKCLESNYEESYQHSNIYFRTSVDNNP